MSAKKPTAKALALASMLKAPSYKPGRTPKTEAHGVLNEVHDHYARHFGLDLEDTANGWLGRYYVPMQRRTGPTQKVLAEGRKNLGADFPLMLDATRACVWALYLFAQNDREAAWVWISDARLYVGLLLGRNKSDELQEKRRIGGAKRKARWLIEFAEVQPQIDELALKYRKRNPSLSDTQVAELIWVDFDAQDVKVAGQRLSVKKIQEHLKKSRLGASTLPH